MPTRTNTSGSARRQRRCRSMRRPRSYGTSAWPARRGRLSSTGQRLATSQMSRRASSRGDDQDPGPIVAQVQPPFAVAVTERGLRRRSLRRDTSAARMPRHPCGVVHQSISADSGVVRRSASVSADASHIGPVLLADHVNGRDLVVDRVASCVRRPPSPGRVKGTVGARRRIAPAAAMASVTGHAENDDATCLWSLIGVVVDVRRGPFGGHRHPQMIQHSTADQRLPAGPTVATNRSATNRCSSPPPTTQRHGWLLWYDGARHARSTASSMSLSGIVVFGMVVLPYAAVRSSVSLPTHAMPESLDPWSWVGNPSPTWAVGPSGTGTFTHG